MKITGKLEYETADRNELEAGDISEGLIRK